MIILNKPNVNAVILRNTALFAPGCIFSANTLDTMFGIELPDLSTATSPDAIYYAINRRNLKRTAAYAKLNKMLADRGISITQKTENFETSYHIREIAQLPKAVTSYRRKGKRALKRSAKLNQAYLQIAIPGIE